MRRMFLIFILCFTIFIAGCSVYLAAREPESKHANVMTVGTPRIVVLGELGRPLQSIVKISGRSDIFSLNYEYEKTHGENARAGKAQLFAVGLWQFVDTSTKANLVDSSFTYRIDYDTGDRVTKITRNAMRADEEFKPSSYDPPA
ncbi:MAG: hypothetical protein ABFD12_12315 [Syntrophorhabdus sp.]